MELRMKLPVFYARFYFTLRMFSDTNAINLLLHYPESMKLFTIIANYILN